MTFEMGKVNHEIVVHEPLANVINIQMPPIRNRRLAIC